MFALAPPAGVPAYPVALALSYEFDKHICSVFFFVFFFHDFKEASLILFD